MVLRLCRDLCFCYPVLFHRVLIYYSRYQTCFSRLFKVDNRTKFANIEIPMIGCVSQLNLGAIKTIGAHNYHNAAVAALSLIGLDVGISTEAISSTIGELQAPPHRMQIGKLKVTVQPFVIFS